MISEVFDVMRRFAVSCAKWVSDVNRNCSSRTPRGPILSKITCRFEDIAHYLSSFPS